MKNSTATTEANYRIRVTINAAHGAQYERTAYVAKNDGRGTWDGSWYTERETSQIKTWKTRAGAERWLAARPGVVAWGGTVEVL